MDKFVIESPEDFDKELSFDKFMDEIVETEEDKKRIKESDGEGENGRKVADKYYERSNNSIRWRK